jgi:hypothetical protein
LTTKVCEHVLHDPLQFLLASALDLHIPSMNRHMTSMRLISVQQGAKNLNLNLNLTICYSSIASADRIGLTQWMEALSSTITGGQQQRSWRARSRKSGDGTLKG